MASLLQPAACRCCVCDPAHSAQANTEVDRADPHSVCSAAWQDDLNDAETLEEGAPAVPTAAASAAASSRPVAVMAMLEPTALATAAHGRSDTAAMPPMPVSAATVVDRLRSEATRVNTLVDAVALALRLLDCAVAHLGSSTGTTAGGNLEVRADGAGVLPISH